jgi:hypothetical protein
MALTIARGNLAMIDQNNTAITTSEQDKANPPPCGQPIVLSLFDLTGNFLESWHKAGYECWCIDIQHPKGETDAYDGDCEKEKFMYVGADLRDWIPSRHIIDRICFVASFSPCDDLAVSGARWFRDESRNKGLLALARSIELFAIGRDWINRVSPKPSRQIR